MHSKNLTVLLVLGIGNGLLVGTCPSPFELINPTTGPSETPVQGFVFVESTTLNVALGGITSCVEQANT